MATRRDAMASLLGGGVAAISLAAAPRASAAGAASRQSSAKDRKMPVVPATLERAPAPSGKVFVPVGEYQTRAADFDYVEEEWFASGVDDSGRLYTTQVFIRRPKDPRRFTGTVIVEPLHNGRIAPIYMYSSPYILRSGHAWACVTSQKTPLDTAIKPTNPERYAALHIEADPSPPGAPDLTRQPVKVGANGMQGVELADPPVRAAYWAEMERRHQASNAILAQAGAAIRGRAGPLSDLDVAKVLLVGHSQTGWVTSNYVRKGHDAHRLAGGAPVFDGFLVAGMPVGPFGPRDVPLIQLVSDGDMPDAALCVVPGYEGRTYRRADSDDPHDRYRLYELAGVPHMGTRYPPHNNPQMWQAVRTAGAIHTDVVMNSLPHHELFNMTLDHLVKWVATGAAPPRAERFAVGADGYFLKDDSGNTRGGVRCVQMDVPRATYHSSPVKPDGKPAFGTVGTEEAFAPARMAALYGDHAAYVARFNARLDDLVRQGWFLAADAEKMRPEAVSHTW